MEEGERSGKKNTERLKRKEESEEKNADTRTFKEPAAEEEGGEKKSAHKGEKGMMEKPKYWVGIKKVPLEDLGFLENEEEK